MNFLLFCLRILLRFCLFFHYLLGFGLFFVLINFLLLLFNLWFFFVAWFTLLEWLFDNGFLEVILFVFMRLITIFNDRFLLYVILLVVQRSVEEVKHFLERWELNWNSCQILLIILHHESLTYFLRIFNLHLTFLRLFFINFFLRLLIRLLNRLLIRLLIIFVVLLIFLFDCILITTSIFHLLPILFFINFVHLL